MSKRRFCERLLISALSLLAVACGGAATLNTQTITMEGFARSFFSNELPTKITVSYVGRTDLTADALLSTQTSSGFQFTLNNVPSGDSAVFTVTGVPLTTAFSFPVVPTTIGKTTFGYIGQLNLQNLKTVATQQGASQGLTIDDTKGIILGVVSEAQRLGVSQIELLVELAQAANANGPFYFNAESNSTIGFKLANSFDTSNGMYVFFNVPEGNYVLRFSGNNGVSAHGVSVPGGSVVMGMDIP